MKKRWKMAIFWPKPWVNPFEKISISRRFELLVFIAYNGRFFVLEYRKNTFCWHIALKKDGKMAVFRPKPWVNPFEKISISWRFELLVFIAQNGRFFVLEYRKTHFPGLYCLRKKDEKMAIFWPKPWVNPFEKISIFRLFQVLFLQPRKAFFRIRIS